MDTFQLYHALIGQTHFNLVIIHLQNSQTNVLFGDDDDDDNNLLERRYLRRPVAGKKRWVVRQMDNLKIDSRSRLRASMPQSIFSNCESLASTHALLCLHQ